MFPTWRLKLREARLAYQGGRYEEAGELLKQSDVCEFLPAKQLASDVAAKFIARAQGRITDGDTAGGWQDLVTARRLGGQEAAIDRLRNQFVAGALREVSGYLAAGESRPALKCLTALEEKGLAGQSARVGRQIAELMMAADRATASGQAAEASRLFARAGRVAQGFRGDLDTMGISEFLNERADESARQAESLAKLSGQMHAALGRQSWSEVLTAAEAMLAISPEHVVAQQAQKRAWRALGMELTRSAERGGGRGSVPLHYSHCERKPGIRSTRRSIRTFEDDTVSGLEQPRRDLLWIDAVGGYLLCYDDQLVLGQPAPDRAIAVPILADLSRRHAVIRRDGGAYLIDPVQSTFLDGRALSGPTLLADKQVIQLGDGVRIRFNKPHALSSTARLTIESGHRTQPRVDGIIMMADSCVLGPSRHCHVPCADWKHDVILFRRGEGLMCRAGCELRVADSPVEGPVALVPGERVEGDDFSFCVEEV
jgi:hypothetical protein